MAANFSLTMIFLAASLGATAVASFSKRVRRSDDPEALQATVEVLSQKVEQLTAQLQSHDQSIAQLQTRNSQEDHPVAFTVTHDVADVHGLGDHEVVKFNREIFNSGSGYATTTGIFTAPTDGSYVFYIHVMRHQSGGTVELDIMKEGQRLGRGYACCTTYNSGSNMATVHLNAGEKVYVQSVNSPMFWGVHTTFSGFRISTK